MKKLFAFLFIFFLSCAHLTGESFLLPTDKEIVLGKKLVPESITQFEGLYPDEEVQSYVRELGNKIAKHAERKLPYEFFVVNSGVLNAFALPGGKIFVTRGLLLELESESELVGVLGHELGHVNARHHVKYLEKVLGLSLLLQVGALLIGGEDLKEKALLQLASIGATLLALKFSRDQEREADLYGIKYAVATGYDPRGLIKVFEKFKKLEKNRPPEWLSTHPLPETRIKEVNKIIKKMNLPKNLKKDSPTFHRIKNKLLATKPSYDLCEEGKKLYKKGFKGEALKKFKKALEIFPKNQVAMVYISAIYLEKGKPKEALNYAQRITEIDPYLLWGWYLKGVSLFELKRYRESIKALEEAKRRVSTYGGTYYYLGRNYEELGYVKRAVENYRKAVKLATGKEPWYEDAKRRLMRYGVFF
ncbi:M48 family metallopeptidase [Aquifex pyrophilus]